MDFNHFLSEYRSIKENTPSYRLGQHFINSFVIKEDSSIEGLWDADYSVARDIIYEFMSNNQWDTENLNAYTKPDYRWRS